MSDKNKVFILDLNPASDLSGKLSDILVFKGNFIVKTIDQSVADQVHEIISQNSLHMLCIVLSPDDLEKNIELVKAIKVESLELPIIAVIDNFMPDETLELLKVGAADFITPPLESIEILPRVMRLIHQAEKRKSFTYALKEKTGLTQIVGKTPLFLNEINKLPLMAKCDSNVLISGESGTGKELFARAIHYLSSRANKPFIPVNCGAIPVDLMENELFGHVRGAFTSASDSQPGLIDDANGGTLFLDEIDCLPLNAQVKFLRFLQDKVYRQLGSAKMNKVDVRIIAATNQHLETAVKEGNFRQDLYYRLNIIPCSIPPLRKRKEDIPLLARHFLGKYTSGLDKEINSITPAAVQRMILHEWPGNVRELENVIERSVVFAKEGIIDVDDVGLSCSNSDGTNESFQAAKAKIVERFEQDYINGVLLANQGNITRAALMAKKNRRAFWALIRKHKIDVQNFKHRSI